MSGRYLTDLAAVLRAAGLAVIEEPGWQTRARSSGGYASGRPTHVMLHHTASGPSSDGQADVNYCCYGSADRPLANLYLSRTGTVWVMAAGCTNTNGKGGPLDMVPADSMNTHAIGVEAANRGDSSEQWPDVQERAYATLAGALCGAYHIPTAQISAHSLWAPTRKIDPAGPSRWADTGTWPVAPFRADVAAGWPGTALLPIGEDEPMDYLELYRNQSQYSLFARSGVLCVNVTNAERAADVATRSPAPPTVRSSDAACLKALVLLGDPPVWYDGSPWPPVSAFGGHIPSG